LILAHTKTSERQSCIGQVREGGVIYRRTSRHRGCRHRARGPSPPVSPRPCGASPRRYPVPSPTARPPHRYSRPGGFPPLRYYPRWAPPLRYFYRGRDPPLRHHAPACARRDTARVSCGSRRDLFWAPTVGTKRKENTEGNLRYMRCRAVLS